MSETKLPTMEQVQRAVADMEYWAVSETGRVLAAFARNALKVAEHDYHVGSARTLFNAYAPAPAQPDPRAGERELWREYAKVLFGALNGEGFDNVLHRRGAELRRALGITLEPRSGKHEDAGVHLPPAPEASEAGK